jgi:hypothetical protein
MYAPAEMSLRSVTRLEKNIPQPSCHGSHQHGDRHANQQSDGDNFSCGRLRFVKLKRGNRGEYQSKNDTDPGADRHAFAESQHSLPAVVGFMCVLIHKFV